MTVRRFFAGVVGAISEQGALVASSSRWRAAVWLTANAGVVLGLAGCAAGGMTLEQFNDSYEQALKQSDLVAVELSGNRSDVLAQLQDYFSEMTAASVHEDTARVYAENAYLNDNLTVVHGAVAIEKYFAATVANSDLVSVRFFDVADAGIDYYVRWEMTIRAQAIKGGEPIRSFGVTQFRFNRDGQVVLHRDFWDSSSGLFEHVPVLGWLILKARHRIESATGS